MIEIECVPDLRERMLAAVQLEGNVLDMSQFTGTVTAESVATRWYPCGTVCCLAGWAINCHPQGSAVLAQVVTTGPYPVESDGHRLHPEATAARKILEACGIPSPDFYDMDDVGDLEDGSANARAMNWLRTGEQE